MAGHSKWANIKHRKGTQDAKRAKLFTRISKEIITAVRGSGGSDEATNPRLRVAILKAKQANMPKDNIEKAIQRGSGELEGASYEEIIYEAYAPGGVAVLIEVMTDNKNRTLPEIKNICSKNGGSLATVGAVNYLFDYIGVFVVEGNFTEDAMLDLVLEVGADDFFITDENIYVIKIAKENFQELAGPLSSKLESLGGTVLEFGMQFLAQNEVVMTEEKAAQANKLFELLEENEDVQNIHHNMK